MAREKRALDLTASEEGQRDQKRPALARYYNSGFLFFPYLFSNSSALLGFSILIVVLRQLIAKVHTT